MQSVNASAVRAVWPLGVLATCLAISCGGGSGSMSQDGGLPGAGGSAGNGGASGAGGAAGGSGGPGGAAGGGGPGGAGGNVAGSGGGPACGFNEFQAAPVYEDGLLESSLPQGVVPTGMGPCITQPEPHTLYPRNWAAPRFMWSGGLSGAIYQLRITSPCQTNALVVYTTKTTWTMPDGLWQALTGHGQGEFTLAVWAMGAGASSVAFSIAPVAVPGSISWLAVVPSKARLDPSDAKAADSNALRSFAIGDAVDTALMTPRDVQMQTRELSTVLRSPRCLGCHTPTPDRQDLGFTDHFAWSDAIASLAAGGLGALPSYMTAGGVDTLRQPWNAAMTFSKSHWAPGDRIAIVADPKDPAQGPWNVYSTATASNLAWLDLESAPVPTDTGYPKPVLGTNFGFIARTGDTRAAVEPAWSNDGSAIAYVSADKWADGRTDLGAADIYLVPYNNRAGGAAVAVPGASEAGYGEYYPAFTPDDLWLAFDRVPAGQMMFANPNAEMVVVPAAGGNATRLATNDPPACTDLKSPGVNNALPRFAPLVGEAGDRKFYWFAFSSNRFGLPDVPTVGAPIRMSQIYVAALVVSGTTVSSTGAIVLPQATTTMNYFAVWH